MRVSTLSSLSLSFFLSLFWQNFHLKCEPKHFSLLSILVQVYGSFTLFLSLSLIPSLFSLSLSSYISHSHLMWTKSRNKLLLLLPTPLSPSPSLSLSLSLSLPLLHGCVTHRVDVFAFCVVGDRRYLIINHVHNSSCSKGNTAKNTNDVFSPFFLPSFSSSSGSEVREGERAKKGRDGRWKRRVKEHRWGARRREKRERENRNERAWIFTHKLMYWVRKGKEKEWNLERERERGV